MGGGDEYRAGRERAVMMLDLFGEESWDTARDRPNKK
jgi:hypothetical protein